MFASIIKFLAIHQYSFLNGLLDLYRTTLFQSPIQIYPRSILIVRKGTLGDIITCIPILLSIIKKYPQSKLSFLTEDFGQKHISASEIIPEDFNIEYISRSNYSAFQLFQLLKAKKFDWVIELPQTQDTFYTQLRNMIFFRLCQIPAGMGWEVISTFKFRKTQLANVRFKDETSRLFQMLNRCGAAMDRVEVYKIKSPTSIEKKYIDERLKVIIKPIAIIAIGAKHERKRWPLKNFIQIANNLENNGFEIIWVGDANDEHLLHSHTQIGMNLCGQLTIAQTAYIFNQATLFVGNDSGPMHLAYACQLPLVAIFSARDYPGKWFPPSNTKHEILHDYSVSCAICVGMQCSNNICMQNISVAQVMEKINQLLE